MICKHCLCSNKVACEGGCSWHRKIQNAEGEFKEGVCTRCLLEQKHTMKFIKYWLNDPRCEAIEISLILKNCDPKSYDIVKEVKKNG